MFGFLRPANYSRDYRQIYASYCAYQRQHYGVAASLFTSYESVFMYLVAVEAGACAAPSATAPTCCRFRSDPMNRWGIDHELASLVSAVAMLLADVKLDDDIRDGRSLVSRGLRAYMRRPIKRAIAVLDQLQKGFSDRIREQIREHMLLETACSTVSLTEYAQPTGKAFELVFQLLQQLCSRRLHREVPLQSLGKSIGESILICDCVTDFRRDHLTGQFTPLRNAEQWENAWRMGLKRLSTAGWTCCELLGENRQTVRILASLFQSFAARPSAKKMNRAWYRMASFRHGVCDCPCDACCVCDVCDVCQGCDGNDGCLNSADCCEGACTGCDIGPGCDCCTCHGSADRRGAKKDPGATQQLGEVPPASQGCVMPVVGQRGYSVGDIDPSGVVEIEGHVWPARSVCQTIPAGAAVVVVDATTFGLHVQPDAT